MSIRTLTDRLNEERREIGRHQQFDAMRSRVTKPMANTATSSTSVAGNPDLKRTPQAPRPHASTPSRVGLRTRDRENPWGVPGGIASRFGRNALTQTPVEKPIVEEQPTEEPEQEIVAQSNVETAATDQPTEDASERENEQDEAARITIELQSH